MVISIISNNTFHWGFVYKCICHFMFTEMLGWHNALKARKMVQTMIHTTLIELNFHN